MILRISHGYEVKEKCDPFVKMADLATEQFSLATAPGGFLVDLIPACKFFFAFLEPRIHLISSQYVIYPSGFPALAFAGQQKNGRPH